MEGSSLWISAISWSTRAWAAACACWRCCSSCRWASFWTCCMAGFCSITFCRASGVSRPAFKSFCSLAASKACFQALNSSMLVMGLPVMVFFRAAEAKKASISALDLSRSAFTASSTALSMAAWVSARRRWAAFSLRCSSVMGGFPPAPSSAGAPPSPSGPGSPPSGSVSSPSGAGAAGSCSLSPPAPSAGASWVVWGSVSGAGSGSLPGAGTAGSCSLSPKPRAS